MKATEDARFPYMVMIERSGKILLQLLVQERWPGQKGNVFCLRVEHDEHPDAAEVECLPVVSLRRYGKRLAVVLDRAKNKRCDFLFLTKQYKTRQGSYEQIFWRTEKALKERRPRVRLSSHTKSPVHIVIDSSERYPWKFPDPAPLRRQLPSGDYALMQEGRIIAVVERKTIENLLADFGRMHAFHQQLSELETYRHAALVIEANYSDFLKPEKMNFYPPSFTARAIAEIQAFHPGLPMIFAGNRKCAQEWAYRFFFAIQAHEDDASHPAVAETLASYGAPPEHDGGTFYDIRRHIEHHLPPCFTIAHLRQAFPAVSDTALRRALHDLKRSGLITSSGRGKKSFWAKTRPE